MGSWNGTCMVSNLPIISGEDIKLIILHNPYGKIYKEDNPFIASSTCYSNTYLQPAFLPISGCYNDYGMIEDIKEDWNYKIIEDMLKSDYGNEIIVDGNNVIDWVLSNFLEGIERGGLQYVKDGIGVDIKMSFIMIRQDIWEHISDNYDGQFWNENREHDDAPYYISSLMHHQLEFNNHIEIYKKKLDRLKELETKEYDVKEQDFVMARFELKWELREFDGSGVFNSRHDKLIAHKEYTDHINHLVEYDGDLDDVFKQWFEHCNMSSFISNTRRLWMIQAGGGSQSENWESYRLLSDKISEITQLKYDERKEYDY